MPLSNYTNGAPFLVTQTQDEGEYTRSLHYLLPDGSRRKVSIDVAHDSETMRNAIGDALASGRRKVGH